MGVVISETFQSAEEGFLVAPSVVRADHKGRLQPIENNGRACIAGEFVVYKSTELTFNYARDMLDLILVASGCFDSYKIDYSQGTACALAWRNGQGNRRHIRALSPQVVWQSI